MLWEEDSFGPQFPLLPEVFPPPEESMDPEDPEDRNQEAGHHNEGPIKHRLSFWIGMGCMGDPQNEVGIGPRVALSTGLHQTFLRNEGFGIIRRKNAVKTVTVSATRDQFWVTQMLDLPMVAFIIGLRSDEENLVPSHHLLVGMAFLTDLCMELLPKLNHLGFIPL